MAELSFLGNQKKELRWTIIVRRDQEYELPQSPQGWQGAAISHNRSPQYYAMTRTYSVPMDFVLDGAYLLRQEFYSDLGIESPVQIKVEQLDNLTGQHTQIFLGDIDFSQFTDTPQIVTVNTMDAGIESKVKAFGDVKFEIPLNVAEAVNVTLTPIALDEQADLLLLSQGGNINDFRNVFPAINVINNQQNSVEASVKSVGLTAQSPPVYSTSNAWFYRATKDTDVEITIDGLLGVALKGAVIGSPTAYDLSIWDSNGVNKLNLFHAETTASGTPFALSGTYTISVLAGERLFLYSATNDGDTAVVIGQGTISLKYKTTSPNKSIKAHRPKYVYDFLIKKMNQDVAYPTQSYLLETTWKQLSITCGDAARGFTDAVIKISWNEFWQSINAECNAEFGDEKGKAVLEAKSNAFKRTLPILNIGVVSDFSLSPYNEYIFNTIKVGYDDQTYDQTEGRKEFNSTQFYRTPITRIQKELDLVSKIRADSLGLYFASINLTNKETKDADSDNDTWFLYLRAEAGIDGAYIPELASVFDSVNGAIDGTYNIFLSPKEMLYRHADYLASMLYPQNDARIFFTSAEKNTDLVVINNGKRIGERDNVEISALGSPMFLPYVATIKCKLPITALANLDAMPNGYVTFIYDDNEYRGYIIEANVDIAKNSSQEFKLLLTPDNNLGYLIK